MSNSQVEFKKVALVGTGAMGQGIAQICAQSGSMVYLFDTRAGAAQGAVQAIKDQWSRLVQKSKITNEELSAFSARLITTAQLSELSEADLVIEAIVERIDVKKELFSALESIVGDACVLVTNTSSLSVTAIASNLKRPARFAGYHFFNPVPLMKVVEVIAGLKTDPNICTRLSRYATQIGHTPVSAMDTPGFIVNHAGRGYLTEALRIASESICDFATVDRVLKDQVGFRLGPFELMDLTALDVSHPVMESIYHQYFEETRYRPNYITAQRLAGGVVGKKVGEGFYKYENNIQQTPPEPPTPCVEKLPPVWVSARAARRASLLQMLKDAGATIETAAAPSNEALCVVAPLGLDVTTVAILERLDPARTVGIDLLIPDESTKRRVIATNPATREDMRQSAHALFAKDGKAVSVIRDSGGFITQRVVAAIVNIACDMCQQSICTPEDLNTAVTLGLGYPAGPLKLGDQLGPDNILETLLNLQTVYGDQRYRPSPWLRRRGALGISLMQREH
jgi:3-hydroxybutyryl-CoA dehydrogenase